jgi:hypothetical protein
MKIRHFFVVAILLLRGVIHAEPIEVSRQQAADLMVALTRIDAGLSSDNVVVAADNINALRPFVESLDRGKIRAQRDMEALPASEERAAKAWAIREKIEAKCDEKVIIELTRMEISADEIKTAKVKPADLAPIRQILKPKK